MPPAYRWTEADRAGVLARRAAGATWDEVAAEWGVCRDTLYRQAKRWGLVRVNGGTAARVRGLAGKGLTALEVADRLGMSVQAVRQTAYRHGFRLAPLPPAKRAERSRLGFAAAGRGENRGEVVGRLQREGSARRGWPPVGTRLRLYLEVLEAAGRPLTRPELATARGVHPDTVSVATGVLHRAGAVRKARGSRPGRVLWELTPAVRQMRKQAIEP